MKITKKVMSLRSEGVKPSYEAQSFAKLIYELITNGKSVPESFGGYKFYNYEEYKLFIETLKHELLYLYKEPDNEIVSAFCEDDSFSI